MKFFPALLFLLTFFTASHASEAEKKLAAQLANNQSLLTAQLADQQTFMALTGNGIIVRLTCHSSPVEADKPEGPTALHVIPKQDFTPEGSKAAGTFIERFNKLRSVDLTLFTAALPPSLVTDTPPPLIALIHSFVRTPG